MHGGMGGLDPMSLLAMSQQGGAGSLADLLQTQMLNPNSAQSDLFAALLGGEGAKNPSQGITNLLGADLIDDAEDLDGDGEPDHLVETRNRIDDYLAKQWLLGKRKLTASVNYGNIPLEYQYLQQYHGMPNPLSGTPLGPKFGLPGPAQAAYPTNRFDYMNGYYPQAPPENQYGPPSSYGGQTGLPYGQQSPYEQPSPYGHPQGTSSYDPYGPPQASPYGQPQGPPSPYGQPQGGAPAGPPSPYGGPPAGGQPGDYMQPIPQDPPANGTDGVTPDPAQQDRSGHFGGQMGGQMGASYGGQMGGGYEQMSSGYGGQMGGSFGGQMGGGPMGPPGGQMGGGYGGQMGGYGGQMGGFGGQMGGGYGG